jgi:heme exporter protein D
MKSNSPRWVWMAFVLAFLTICYVAMPRSVVQHAAALSGWG